MIPHYDGTTEAKVNFENLILENVILEMPTNIMVYEDLYLFSNTLRDILLLYE